jgi:hypothetical protein
MLWYFQDCRKSRSKRFPFWSEIQCCWRDRGFLGWALFKKVNVFESFIEGAKAGFTTSVTIIPYLVGLLVAISAFRSCGAMDYLIDGLKWAFALRV